MTPLTSKEQDLDIPWGWSCPDCPWLPPRGGEPDYVQVTRRIEHDWGHSFEQRSLAIHVPIRCQTCDNRKKRQTRMRNRVRKVFRIGRKHGSYYSRPKLITFALPSLTSHDYEDRFRQLRLLNSRLPRARSILKDNGVKGGIYVLECTSRLLPLDQGNLLEWKHHAHVHMVGIAPYMRRDRFVKFSSCLMQLGLGRLNVEALANKTHNADQARMAVAVYISKYLNKDGGRCRSFGEMREQK